MKNKIKKKYAEGGASALAKHGKQELVKMGREALSPVASGFVRLLDNHTEGKNIILFGSRRGFEGNSRYVYEEMLEEKEYSPIWVAYSSEVYNQVASSSLPVISRRSVNSLRRLAQTKATVTNLGLSDITPVPSAIPNRIFSVYATHGWHLPKDNHIPSEPVRNPGIPYNCHICSSQEHMRLMILRKFGYEKVESVPKEVRDKFAVTGYPKTDAIFNPSQQLKSKWDEFTKNQDYTNAILYAPHKGFVPPESSAPRVDFFPFDDFSVSKLHRDLERTDSVLYLRPHPNDTRKMKFYTWGSFELFRNQVRNLVKSSDRIRLAHNESISTFEMLPFIDFLITDNSEVYFDFLASANPVAFIDDSCYPDPNQHDFSVLDNYKAGPTVNSYDAFQEYLYEATSGNDAYQRERRDTRDVFYRYTDGNSSERVSRLIKSVLG